MRPAGRPRGLERGSDRADPRGRGSDRAGPRAEPVRAAGIRPHESAPSPRRTGTAAARSKMVRARVVTGIRLAHGDLVGGQRVSMAPHRLRGSVGRHRDVDAPRASPAGSPRALPRIDDSGQRRGPEASSAAIQRPSRRDIPVTDRVDAGDGAGCSRPRAKPAFDRTFRRSRSRASCASRHHPDAAARASSEARHSRPRARDLPARYPTVDADSAGDWRGGPRPASRGTGARVAARHAPGSALT